MSQLTASELQQIESILKSNPGLKDSLLSQTVVPHGERFGIEAEKAPSPYYAIKLIEQNTVLIWGTPAGQRQSRVVRLTDNGVITVLSDEYFYVPFELEPNISHSELVALGLVSDKEEEEGEQ